MSTFFVLKYMTFVAMLLFVVEVLILVKTMDAESVEHQNFQEKACDLMLVSYAGPTKGKTVFLQYKVLNNLQASFRSW